MELILLPLMNGLEKYNRKDLMNTRIKVETKDEITRIKALQKEIKQLKELLLKKDIDALVPTLILRSSC